MDVDRGRRHPTLIVATAFGRPDKGTGLIGRWPLAAVRLTEESYPRKAGPIPLGAWRAVRFEFPDRDQAVLQPFGYGIDALLEAHRAAQSAEPELTEVARWRSATRVSPCCGGGETASDALARRLSRCNHHPLGPCWWSTSGRSTRS